MNIAGHFLRSRDTTIKEEEYSSPSEEEPVEEEPVESSGDWNDLTVANMPTPNTIPIELPKPNTLRDAVKQVEPLLTSTEPRTILDGIQDILAHTGQLQDVIHSVAAGLTPDPNGTLRWSDPDGCSPDTPLHIFQNQKLIVGTANALTQWQYCPPPPPRNIPSFLKDKFYIPDQSYAAVSTALMTVSNQLRPYLDILPGNSDDCGSKEVQLLFRAGCWEQR